MKPDAGTTDQLRADPHVRRIAQAQRVVVHAPGRTMRAEA